MTDLVEPLGGSLVAQRRPVTGYSMAVAGATLFAFNGTVAKVMLRAGLIPATLTEFRSTASLLLLLVGVLFAGPARLRVHRSELPLLALFGAAGFTFVQWFYFIAISRLPVGIALLIEYLAPLMVALYARFVLHQAVRNRAWVGLGLALVGLTAVAQVRGNASLDVVGVTAAIGAAGALTIYYLAGERLLRNRDVLSLTTWGLGFASAVSAVLAPWWHFPWPTLQKSATIAAFGHSITQQVWVLGAWLVVFGTVLPFLLVVGCLRHLRATQAGIVGMTEPVIAAVVAYFVLSESLSPTQLVGGAIVLTAVVLAETSRPEISA